MSVETLLPVSVTPKNDPQAREWLEANQERNGFEACVLDYPATVLLKVGDRAVMPLQNAAFLESIGFDPSGKLSPLECAEAVMNLTAAAIKMSNEIGIGEVYFVATDRVTANGAKLMGFEELPYPVYRLKIAKVLP